MSGGEGAFFVADAFEVEFEAFLGAIVRRSVVATWMDDFLEFVIVHGEFFDLVFVPDWRV